LPLGTYTISNTLELIQNLYVRDNGKIAGTPQYPCVLIGSRKQPGKRPVIRLADHSAGFDDVDSRKHTILFWSRNYGREDRESAFKSGPDMAQANIGFNQVFMDIDIQIGQGNPGAVGISMQAAEGSTIQNVTIDVTNGHTGMLGVAGSGGSHHNITVLGGQIGIDIRGFAPQFTQEERGSQPGPTMSHITLINQSDKALITRAAGTLTAVGWKVISKGHGPLVSIKSHSWVTCGGSASFIDSQFIFKNPDTKNKVFLTKPGFMLENVFVKNAQLLVDDIKLNQAGWTRIGRMAVPREIGILNVHGLGKVEQTIYPYINGVRVDQTYREPFTNTAPPQDLCSRHIWAEDFPNWETPGAINVKNPPYNAKGDSIADDTAAIQKAIDEHEIVFLPKGYYRLTDTLKLKSHTKLIGLIHPFSVLMQRDAWGKLASTKPMPVVSSPDDPDADTTLAFMSVAVSAGFDKRRNPAQTTGLYGLQWRSGAKSMVRQVMSKFIGAEGVPKEHQTVVGFTHPWAHVTGHGGGRWYNFHVLERLWKFRPGYRHLLVENTSAPLSIYHLHAQHAAPNFSVELRHAANVSLYGCKQEIIGKAPFMKISHCNNVRVFGLSGWAMPMPGEANFLVENSNNFLIACYAPFQEYRKPTVFTKNPWTDSPTGKTNIKDIFPIIERLADGSQVKVSPFDAPLLYMRGKPESR